MTNPALSSSLKKKLPRIWGHHQLDDQDKDHLDGQNNYPIGDIVGKVVLGAYSVTQVRPCLCSLSICFLRLSLVFTTFPHCEQET